MFEAAADDDTLGAATVAASAVNTVGDAAVVVDVLGAVGKAPVPLFIHTPETEHKEHLNLLWTPRACC